MTVLLIQLIIIVSLVILVITIQKKDSNKNNNKYGKSQLKNMLGHSKAVIYITFLIFNSIKNILFDLVSVGIEILCIKTQEI